MENKKDDRRVKYTKMILKDTFIDLLENKDLSKISVKEICEQADINRTTFYNHYNDPYDLMTQLENELLENIEAYLAQYAECEANVTLLEIVEKIFDYIMENAKLCKMLLGDKGNLNFQKRIMMIVYDKDVNNLSDKKHLPKEELDYIYSYMITGSIGVIQKWLDDNMKSSSHSMARILMNLTAH